MKSSKDSSLLKAKQRVKKMKEFYKHVVAFVLVNLFLTFVWKFSFKIFGDFVISNHFNEDGFTHIPIWFIWGIFLAADAIKTFGLTNRFTKDWEEKKIKEFMKE
jgi:hypothetical protein